MDDLDFEPTGPVRVAGRFRPKAKPKSTKVASTAAASDLPNVGVENSNTVSTTVSDTVPCADLGEVNPRDPVGLSSEISGSLEPSGNNEHLCSSVPSFDGEGTTKPSETAAGDTLQPSVIVATSNVSDGSNSVIGKSAGENADVFSGSHCLDNIVSQTASGTVPSSTKSPDKVNEGKFSALTDGFVESSALLACDVAEAQTVSDNIATQDPISCTEAAMSNEDGKIRLETKEFGTLDDVSDAPISTGLHRAGKFQPKLRVKKGKENQIIPHSEVESTALSQAANFEICDVDESSLSAFPPGDVHNHISPTFGDSNSPNPNPVFQAYAESLAETTQLDEAVVGGAAHSEDVFGRGHESGNVNASAASNCHQNCKGSAAYEEAKDGTSSRKSRKPLPHQQVDEPGNCINEESFNAEDSNDKVGNEDREHNTERGKRVPRKSKKPASENEKPVKKGKRTKKVLDESMEEPKKKFSHSTSKNKRSVNKSLLEIPEDEIDPQKVSLRDLIRLTEYRERLASKEAAKLKTPASNQSAYDEFQKDPSHNKDENSGFEQDRSPGEDQAGYREGVSTSSISFNYQTYMNKERPSKWVEQDTELFYEGVEQFGSDFSMIAQLFPGRTRHQIKLKFKKEDRQNPFRVSEAFRRHSKDNSKYVMVINELQKVAREKQESNAEESNDQQEVELTLDNDEGVSKPELDKVEDMETDVAPEVQHEEAAVAEVHSPMNPDQSDGVVGFGGWDDEF
ncbi:uncharacterized protein LOC126783876 isoform X2 [Argentina anserina]|uniref:uncharacterized protein LOC126783876 isoform X2 n=1 Tax=Argentina anserina TaxID=57926 RepID=UPI0021768DE0|nr:uncharacterized protein LOC126783876 isoform X2 [Potentilla anserina]